MNISKQFKLLIIFPFALNAYAQSSVDNPLAPLPVQSPGVERVGAVPLPTQDYGNMPVSQKASEIEFSKPHAFNKGRFESTHISGRILYLNGENISSVREQELENVNIRIDKQGNIFIEAPQYEVSTEQNFHPLLPKELPKFSKENVFEKLPIPKGVYSKESGKALDQSDTIEQIQGNVVPSPVAKEIVSEANSQQKIPQVNLDGVKKSSEKSN